MRGHVFLIKRERKSNLKALNSKSAPNMLDREVYAA